ncbi:hypothetical protein E2562_014594 [Oryza meyeriana var. granulata]|uniref:Uncharacterized protein n=1 Tax=Oryza meyeriana var. granulata TaxID=110450 RepID=A0A6G1DWQ1_9ORYZ|nr:hypothetical protein E2562_014594 [Oryza meyeriana var. granulata]
MGRAPCCDKASVKRGPWSPEEDELLRSYVRSHGTGGNWIALPQKAGLNRCGKSCRLRWLNYLRPDIKHGGYTEQEDRIICSLYNSIGSRWSIIASKLPGRTDNDVKNYWNTKLKKKAMAMHHQPQQQLYHHHHHRAAGGARVTLVSPPPAPQSQCGSMQPSPASASSSVATTASGDACSFGAMYSPSPSTQAPQAATLAGYTSVAAAQHSPLAELICQVPPPTAAADCWASGVTLDDVFLPELVGAGEFPNGDLFGGFGPLLQERSSMELSACYFPNAPAAEMWAAADVKPAGLCHSLT